MYVIVVAFRQKECDGNGERQVTACDDLRLWQVGADVWAQWENEGLVVEDGWNDSDMAVRE